MANQTVKFPSQSKQDKNVIVRTAHYLTQFVETVPIDPTSWEYIAEGEWVECGSDGKYKIPDDAKGNAVDLSGKKLYFVLGKKTDPSNQVLMLEVQDTDNQAGCLPIYKGHDPVEVDFKFYDSDSTWNVGDPAYVVSIKDSNNKIRAILSADSSKNNINGKKVGVIVRVPTDNNGYVRVELDNL